ncbi:MAG: orotate phosphoribosyltransferase [Thaumarchaeota archaeon]|nr:orotate phosphoribosyltransferase [Nitrososphaerota archaeon]
MSWKKRDARLRELSEGLVKAGALQFGTFTLPDGSESSYYVNLRGIPSYPGLFKLVVEAMSGLVSSKAPKVDSMFTVPVAGLAIASPVALAMNKPLAYARSVGRADERSVEGEVRPGWNVAVIDDLASTGKTILGSAEAVEREGGSVKHAFVFIDRLQGARERLSKNGIALHSVTDALELADTLHSMELISGDNLKAITKTVGGR